MSETQPITAAAARQADAGLFDEQPPKVTWRSPRGVKAKQTEDVRVVELSLTVAVPGEYDRHGARVRAPKTDEEILAMIKAKVAAVNDDWPRWLRVVEVFEVYDPREDE